MNDHVNCLENESKAVNKIKETKEYKGKCKFCGNKHIFKKGECPAYGQKCKLCAGKNHFAKVCKKKSNVEK